jgi:hypothetical protein
MRNINLPELLNIYLNNKDEYSSRYPLEWSTIIRAILPSIIAFSPEATIYIADNASTDESIACNSTTCH